MRFYATPVASWLLENATSSISLPSSHSLTSKKFYCGTACNALKHTRADTAACNTYFFSSGMDRCFLLALNLTRVKWYTTAAAAELSETFLDARLDLLLP